MCQRLTGFVLFKSQFALGCSQPFAFHLGQWIDLSYEFSSETIYWPTAEPFHLEVEAAGITEKGYYYAANNYGTAEHGGTHIDAPIHFAQTGRTVDQIPLKQLIGPAVVIDVSVKALADRDCLIETAEIAAWETAHDTIPHNAIVLFRTGYGRYWPDPVRYLGTAKRGPAAVVELHFPGLAPDTTRSKRIQYKAVSTKSLPDGIVPQ